MHKIRAVIVHGSFGYPEENWFPWAAQELKSLGIETLVPRLPTPENQRLGIWLEVFTSVVGEIDNHTILIGHSLGVPFLLRVLENATSGVKATVLVGGFFESVKSPLYDPLNETFIQDPFDWDRIKRHAGILRVYASDNDPIVPLRRSQHLAKKLNTPLIMVANAGHFNSKAGYTKFPKLISDLSTVLSSNVREIR